MDTFDNIDTTTSHFANYYITAISTKIVSHPVNDRVEFIKGVIQGVDRRIAKGNIEFKAFRKIFVAMKRDAKEAAKVAARTSYSIEAKA